MLCRIGTGEALTTLHAPSPGVSDGVQRGSRLEVVPLEPLTARPGPFVDSTSLRR